MPTIKPDWYSIVNPHAGSGKTMHEWHTAEKQLTRHKVPYKTTLTNYKFHATLLAYEAASHGYRKFLTVGGDGSVHEVFSGIMKYCDETGVAPEDFTLAVIPIGSGNDWIKTNHIPHDTAKVVRLIAEESFGMMDVVSVETSEGRCHMANVGGTGFDAHVCKIVNTLKERGNRSARIYVTALMRTIFTMRKSNISVKADGVTVFEGASYSLAIGNGPYSGGGMKQVPLADNNDGLIDYMVVRRVPLLKLLGEIKHLFDGTVNESDIVVHGQCRQLEVTGDDIVEIDGEVKGNLPLKVSAAGSKIRILKRKSSSKS
ncbi:MAG: YegS/Rv2252/BmrU family lipid kinase [Bacteroidales bacterium]|nr:YegS/Rv2252/BmrU family lipid kinase [Bacteroidales bacterium]